MLLQAVGLVARMLGDPHAIPDPVHIQDSSRDHQIYFFSSIFSAEFVD